MEVVRTASAVSRPGCSDFDVVGLQKIENKIPRTKITVERRERSIIDSLQDSYKLFYRADI
jgi:hypothetical protein